MHRTFSNFNIGAHVLMANIRASEASKFDLYGTLSSVLQTFIRRFQARKECLKLVPFCRRPTTCPAPLPADGDHGANSPQYGAWTRVLAAGTEHDVEAA